MRLFLFAIVLVSWIEFIEPSNVRSSHSEAPGITKSPQADNIDFYMFRSYEVEREDYTTFLMNVHGLQDPYGGPNYFALSDDHFYQIKIDNDGDAVEDISIQFYTGNRLGGDEYETEFVPERDDCIIDDNYPSSSTKHKGLTVPILNVDGTPAEGTSEQYVPLKFIGPIYADSDNTGSLNWYEWYQINWTTSTGTAQLKKKIDGNEKFPKPFDYAGEKTFGSAADYETYAREHIYEFDIPGCAKTGRVFVGQRKEGFYLNLGGIFDLVNFIPIEGFITQDKCNNDLRYSNVDTFAIELPTECVVGDSSIIGAWTTVNQLCHNGDSHEVGYQVSRLGSPLVNELVIGIADKGDFNKNPPTLDGEFLNFVQYPSFPSILNILFREAVSQVRGVDYANLAPAVPRNDLVATFLTGIKGLNQPEGGTPSEMLRLNTAIAPVLRNNQNNLGVIAGDNAGFPNGRRPGDDTVDIVLRVAMGRLCILGLGLCDTDDAPVGDIDFTDGAPVNASDFDDHFPYLRTPETGSPWAGRKCPSPPVKNSPPLGNCGLGKGSFKTHSGSSLRVKGCPNGAENGPKARSLTPNIQRLLQEQERVVDLMQKNQNLRSVAHYFDQALKYNQRLVASNFTTSEEPFEFTVTVTAPEGDIEQFDRLSGIFDRANAGMEFYAYSQFGYSFEALNDAESGVPIDSIEVLGA